MTKNNSCIHPDTPLNGGNWFDCNKCGQLLWRAEDGGPIFQVPTVKEATLLSGGRRKIIDQATDPADCEEFESGFTLRTRLNIDLDYITGQTPLPSMSKTQDSRQSRINEILNRVNRFGLTVTRLVADDEISANEPIWIHRLDQNPQSTIPPLLAAEDDISAPFPEYDEDPRWKIWEENVKGTFASQFGQYIFPRQQEAIERVLKRPRSLTIVGLPTGFGKTRIAQVATHLIRRTEGNDTGPTLIISPLISLMDDQRIRWNEDLNKMIQSQGREPLKCRFLTAAENADKREVIGELLRDEIDVLCCSPESLLKPRRGNSDHWLEIIQKMPNPFSLFVVDEAHSIADWGASIRPEFQLLDTIKRAILRRNLNLRVLLMSATITEEEEIELRRMFGADSSMHSEGKAIREPEKHACATRRDLMFDFKKVKMEDADDAIQEIKEARSHIIGLNDWHFDSNGKQYRKDGRPSSVIVFTRKKVDARGYIKKAFDDMGNPRDVATYTGDTPALGREMVLKRFLADEVRYLIATSAFGMGVDKKDVWLAAYLGQPYTLKGLYQAFGRAARDAGWDKDGKKRSGLCVGRFYGRNQPFNPRMGIKLSMERIFDLLSRSANGDNIFDNGYLLLDLTQSPYAGWSTNPDSEKTIKNLEQEEDAGQDEFDLLEGKHLSVDIRNQNEIQKIRVFLKERRRKNSSFDAHLNLRMWVLSCLERTGAISIVGVHPEAIGQDDKGELVYINDLFSNSKSYDEVNESAGKLRDFDNHQRRLVAVRINRTIESYDDIIKEMQDGIKQLKDRHEIGLGLMKEFMSYVEKGTGCLRKAFARSVGRNPTEEATCIESIRDHKQPVMPCSNCRGHPWLKGRDFPQKGPLFSTPEVMNVLSGHGRYILKTEPQKYFRIDQLENLSTLQPYTPYGLMDEGFDHLLPPQGQYILVENSVSIGKVRINKKSVTFSEIDPSGIQVGFNMSITFRYNNNQIELHRK